EALEKQRTEAKSGLAEIAYHGKGASQDTLGGSSPEGALVKTADVRPFFSPDAFEMHWISSLETLEWRQPDGKRRVLWSGYNLYSYPSAPAAGTPVVFVEDLFGWAKT